MKNKTFPKKEGYLMVEIFCAISISLIVMNIVTIILKDSNNLVNQTDNRIEIMEQFSEMKSTIKRELRNSNNIKFYYKGNSIFLDNKFERIDKIRFSQFEDVKNGNPVIINREMFLSRDKNKIFIYYNGGSFEIGNYVVDMEVRKESKDNFSIKLKLNKNNNNFNDIINIRTRN